MTQRVALVAPEVGELVFTRKVPPAASMFDCLRLAWQEAQSEARCTSEHWRGQNGPDAHQVCRAAQDRADAAQDTLRTVRSGHCELVAVDTLRRRPPGQRHPLAVGTDTGHRDPALALPGGDPPVLPAPILTAVDRRAAETAHAAILLPVADHFWLSLPSSRSEMAMIGSVARSVLVVDDDPEFRELARRLLAASGMAVVGESDSVSAALSDADRLRPSAVLVDVELPDGDGIALARELAALPWHPQVVLTSIDGDITTTDEARSVGARAFVHKAELPNTPLAELLGGE